MDTRRWLQLALVAWTGGMVGYIAYGWTWIPTTRWAGWPTWVVGGLLALGGALLAVLASALLARRQRS